MTPQQRSRLKARILANIRVDKATGCWLWLLRKNNDGYGIITMRVPGYSTPRPLYAHRVSYEVFRRAIPDGKILAHAPKKCRGRRHCVHPYHVRATTQASNCKDKAKALKFYELRRPKHRLAAEA